jgi:kynurenine 3-monooxygenase
VGSVLAVMLAQEGYQVEVFEKREDPTAGNAPAGRSVNLALTRRAIRAFEQIGAKERILEHAIPMYGRSSHNSDGVHFHQYGKVTDCNYSISRGLLNNLLIQVAKETPNVTMHFNHTLKSFDTNQ